MKKPKHTILVVDDEPDVVMSVKELLRQEYRVLGATNARQGMEALASEEVHVLMTDQRMPGMSGVELLRHARGEHPSAIRILFTGYADIRDVIDSINVGHVYRYLSKPWDPDVLQSTIRDAVARYEALAEAQRERAEAQRKEAEIARVGRALHEQVGHLIVEASRAHREGDGRVVLDVRGDGGVDPGVVRTINELIALMGFRVTAERPADEGARLTVEPQ